MTIRASNWCQDCEEECNGHSRLCTQCGGTLTARPSTSTANTNNVSFRAMPSLEAFLPAEYSMGNVREQLEQVREQVRATTELAEQALVLANAAGAPQQQQVGDWQAIPAALLDPSAGVSSGKTPTSPQVLQKLPRETLHAKSASFFQVTLSVNEKNYDGAVTGELGLLPSIHNNTTSDDATENATIEVEAPLWIPSTRNQRTGKDPFSNIPTSSSVPFVAVLERGHGISFFTKSMQSEKAGACAVIMINDKETPWPYVMKDSRSDAQKDQQGRVSIPVVMVSLAQGRELLQTTTSSDATTTTATAKLSVAHKNSQESCCVICTDTFQLGQTTLTLTNYCGHAFHEQCALQWLKSHNTCPYCRRSLPTDNPDDERERLRQMTGGNGTSNNGGTAESFYS